jgi:hypothetical protein
MQSNGSYEISYIPHQKAYHSKKLFYMLKCLKVTRGKVLCGGSTLIQRKRAHFTALCTHRMHGEIFMEFFQNENIFLPQFFIIIIENSLSLAIFTNERYEGEMDLNWF